MSGTTERLLERSEQAVEFERDRRVQAIRGALNAQGSADCRDCGEEIEAKRRSALPSAKTCISCQTARERGQFR